MGGGAQKDDDEMITAINVTPLVDVVLVLLIILMVTASYIASRSIPMDLPSASTAEPGQQPRTLAISIDAEGQLYLDAEAVQEDALRGRVQSYVRDVGEAEARATIAADSRVSHGQVVRIIDLLRRERVAHFAINVRPEDIR
ncbi:MAG: biopolymer transporter ExbD [Sandaracinaceae bacterium]